MKLLTLFAALLISTSTLATEKTPLTLKVYNASDKSFHVNSTLIYGEKEAVVIDGGFTRADGLRIAANVLDSGKTLTTIFISQSDPDYYFGAEVLKQMFPNAKVLATPSVLKMLEKKKAGKIAFWSPEMGVNAPVYPVTPEPFKQKSFTVDGYRIEIKGTEGGLAHRPYLWVPSLKAIVGNIAVFDGLHVWTADVQTPELQKEWFAQLEEMQSLKPEVVVPGHMAAGSKLNGDGIRYTIEYLKAFNTAKQNSKSSEALIETMTTLYPEAQLSLALNIGAKVHMGEMKW
ncbi:MBL fold metallo-hydrolase [Arenicella xantha]|nr:MBL fold metallo-hydrolase [Arenicella xantha]